MLEGFEKLKFVQVSNKEDRDLSLKSSPAIYAWYRDLEGIVQKEKEKSPEEVVERLLDSNVSDCFSGKIGYLYHLQLSESPGGLPEKKRETLKRISDTKAKREIFYSFLEEMTFLQAPLYVGKASDLNKRISDHVQGYSGLKERLMRASINMEDCVLLYKHIPEEYLDQLLDQSEEHETSNKKREELISLFEDLFTRLGPAAFVKRPG